MNRETLNKIIRNRKTIYPSQFSDKEIPENTINEILENAIHAPTHRMTQPWFFRVYKGKSKDVLCQIIDKIDQVKYSEVKINKFIEKVKSSDTIISVYMTKDDSNRVPEWEEIAAVSMAVQNMWLSCYVNNIGSYWSTPAFKDDYAKHSDLNSNQKSLGFFFMGSYKHIETPKVREGLDSKVEWV